MLRRTIPAAALLAAATIPAAAACPVPTGPWAIMFGEVRCTATIGAGGVSTSATCSIRGWDAPSTISFKPNQSCRLAMYVAMRPPILSTPPLLRINGTARMADGGLIVGETSGTGALQMHPWNTYRGPFQAYKR